MTSIMKWCAAIGALALLCIQINFAVDHTGLTSDLAAPVAAYACLAVIPWLAVGAFGSGRLIIGSALCISAFCFLTYSLPISVGRAGEAREREAAIAAQHLTAKRAMIAECATGNGRNCKGRRATWESMGGNKIPPGDIGTETLAWMLPVVDPASLRKISAICLGIGLDLAILSLSAFAGGGSRRTAKAVPPPPKERARQSPPRPATKPTKETIGDKWLRKHLETTPDTTVATAYASYRRAKLPGRAMSKQVFHKKYIAQRPSNVVSIAA